MSAIEIPNDPARGRRIAEAHKRFPGDTVDSFVEGMFRTDSLIDAVADELADSGRAGWQAIDEALALCRPTVDGAPPSLEALLDPVMSPPAWFDPEQVRWGAALWWRFWLSNQIGLAGSLRTGYKFGDLNKPQAMNGRSTVMAARRYEETARWVLDATEPDALVPGGTGFSSTMKVRLVHAMVRRRLRRDPAWNTAAWGEPIHTSGMALTGIAFLILPLAAVEMVGIEYTADEKEAIRALWHWVCHLMGVAEPLLPHTIEHARSIAEIANVVFAPPDDDTRILDNAVMRNGIRAERALPAMLRPLMAPVLRPIFSYGIWGVSNAIVTQIEEHTDELHRVDHPVVRALRPVVARREKLRRRGQLGSDFEISARQRRGVTAALRIDPRRATDIAAAPGDGSHQMTAEAREQIVNAASTLFAKQGISATSMAQIAKAAGISRAWLYRNFDSRDPIVREALARYAGQAATMLTDADHTDRPVDQAVIAVFCHLVTHGRRQLHIPEALAADPASVIGPAVVELQRYLVHQRAVLPETQGRIAAEAIARLILSAITTTSITVDFDDPKAVAAFANQVMPQLLTAGCSQPHARG